MTYDSALQPGTGRCQVTGKIVPEDELVTIQDQRVCAEGKAILLDRLKAGETLPGEAEKPSVLRRFGAILLDAIIVGVPFAILARLVVGDDPSNLFFRTGIFTIVSTAVTVVYFGAMHARNGQTLGKMAAKLRVVNDAGSGPVAAQAAYVRALVYAGPNFLSALAYLTSREGLVMAASVLVGVWGLANVVAALMDSSRQRALHDRITGTRVIETR